MARKIEISSSKFERSHGRKPKGHGAWGFIVMDDSCDREVEIIFSPSMPLNEAKKWAKDQVRAKYAAEIETGYLSLEVAP